MGSEEFIRLQFEEYLLALLSSVKYHIYLESPQNPPLLSIEGDPSTNFNPDWIHSWRQTSSFALFAAKTDPHIFEIVEPRHPTAGNLSLEDIQRRFALQIQTLHLDERLASSKDLLNKHFASGQKKVSTAFQNLWADIEAMREAQRKRAELGSNTNANSSPYSSPEATSTEISQTPASLRYAPRAPDLSNAPSSVSAASQKAGAYFYSWGAWASERRKGWTTRTTGVNSPEEITAREDKRPVDEEGAPIVREKSSLDSGEKGRTKKVREEKGSDGIGRLM